ncbi:MAG: hypothetical protein US67_C0036G0009 [Candidatus Woesebacteria bacterium GW2011_GWD1_38_10]|uniref:Uncharacterized protein n=1 Tax=Candidatus Woesebacteria bacterium GW2011_GWD1_38_10 TaxID=1618592 RepID=A0A0G0L6Q7_9BACT|nr:MAG: hypothetical protein US67_C0036G0009 [Candidatus Woesebacteria bacterium GW2011_GWD1_38_10]
MIKLIKRVTYKKQFGVQSNEADKLVQNSVGVVATEIDPGDIFFATTNKILKKNITPPELLFIELSTISQPQKRTKPGKFPISDCSKCLNNSQYPKLPLNLRSAFDIIIVCPRNEHISRQKEKE